MAEKLFQGTDVSLGTRVEFVYQWSQWINETKQQDNNHATNEKYFKEQNPSSNEGSKKKSIELTDVLNTTTYGKTFVEAYNKTNSLTDNLRKILVDAVLQFCAINNLDLSVSDCAYIGSQICETFPGELISYYYLERKNAAPLGKLYNKYRNWKYNLNRKSKTLDDDDHKKQKNSSFTIADDEEDHIRVLKHNFKTMAYQEKMHRWSACAATRMNYIRHENNAQKIFDIWPQYKSSDGFRLIESDFTFLFGARNEVLDNLNNFACCMLEKVFPKHTKELKDNGLLSIFDEMVKQKNNLSEDSIHASVFLLLHALLPRSRINKKLSVSKTNDKKRFYSVKESQHSFMAVCATEAEYKQMYDLKVKEESSVPPFITLIGTLQDPEIFLVDFDNITFKFFSFAKAIDTCFKAYNVFNISYALPCYTMWDFLNREFYKLPVNDKAKPSLEMLLNEIKLVKEAISKQST